MTIKNQTARKSALKKRLQLILNDRAGKYLQKHGHIRFMYNFMVILASGRKEITTETLLPHPNKFKRFFGCKVKVSITNEVIELLNDLDFDYTVVYDNMNKLESVKINTYVRQNQ